MGTQGESGRAAAVVYSRAKQWIDMSHYTTIDAANNLERPLRGGTREDAGRRCEQRRGQEERRFKETEDTGPWGSW